MEKEELQRCTAAPYIRAVFSCVLLVLRYNFFCCLGLRALLADPASGENVNM